MGVQDFKVIVRIVYSTTSTRFFYSNCLENIVSYLFIFHFLIWILWGLGLCDGIFVRERSSSSLEERTHLFSHPDTIRYKAVLDTELN